MGIFESFVFSPLWNGLVLPLQSALSGVNGFCVVCW